MTKRMLAVHTSIITTAENGVLDLQFKHSVGLLMM